MSKANSKKSRPFNTAIESGLRSLFLLEQISPTFRDLQRLVYYDYLLVHSNDASNNLTSLHPPIPYRSGEWLVRRKLIADGLDLMFAKELLRKNFDETGISFAASELTTPFLRYFVTDYAVLLRESSKWVANRFEKYSDKELSNFMTENLGQWGAEFKRESIIRGLPL
jgi:hypothetical protein